MRRAPECARARLRNRPGRMARAIAGVGPPRHRHVATVDRIEAAAGLTPIEAVGASRARRGRRGDGAVAAPLMAVGLRPVRDLFRDGARLGRAATAVALVLPQTMPKHAVRAVRGTLRRVVQGGPLLLVFSTAQRVSTSALASDDHPPPSASISPTLASSWRARKAITVRSASSAAFCAVTTSR